MSKYSHLVMEPKMAQEAKTNPEAQLVSSLTAMRMLEK